MADLIDDVLAFARLGGRLKRVPVALDGPRGRRPRGPRDRPDLGERGRRPAAKVVGDPAQLRAVS